MYLPKHFSEQRPEVIRAFVERHPLGALVAVRQGELCAEHVPMILYGKTLRAHVARANSIWRELAPGSPVLVIFQGADAYVSPSVYPSKSETGQVVPTWNYAVVHVRGTIRFIEDAAWLRAFVTELTQRHEAPRARPWAVGDAPDAYVDALLQAIVGLEIEVTSVDGKWKASQNRNDADRAGVEAGFAAEGRTEEERSELVKVR